MRSKLQRPGWTLFILSQKQVIKEDSEKSTHYSSSRCSSHPRTPTGSWDSHRIFRLPRDPQTPTGFLTQKRLWARHLNSWRHSTLTTAEDFWENISSDSQVYFWGATSRGGNKQQPWLYEQGDFTMTFMFYESASVPHSYWVLGTNFHHQ